MAYANHAFCWNGLVTTNPEATAAFFPEVFGWKRDDVEMGDETITMFAHDGAPIAHLRKPAMAGEPSWWNNYLRVEDVDATASAVEAAGGKVLVPPNDIPPGRFSTVTTPSGAFFTLFHEAEAGAANRDGEVVGNVTWRDLHSQDIDTDLAFLTDVLGFSTSGMDMPNGKYHLLNAGTASRAGAMAGMHAGAPSFWLAWVKVDSVDDTLARITSHNGEVVAPAWDAPGVGRMAIAKDPAGVTFGIMTPAEG